MVQALEAVAGAQTTALIDWDADPRIAAIVTGWPHRIHASRAQALGLGAETRFEALIRDYMQENPGALAATVRTVVDEAQPR